MTAQTYPRAATSVRVGRCSNPDCGGIHIMLYDAAGDTIASAAIPAKTAVAVADQLMQIAAEMPVNPSTEH